MIPQNICTIELRASDKLKPNNIRYLTRRIFRFQSVKIIQIIAVDPKVDKRPEMIGATVYATS
jgi:hypothetical protein